MSAWKSRGSDHFLMGSASVFENLIFDNFGNLVRISFKRSKVDSIISSALFPSPFR